MQKFVVKNFDRLHQDQISKIAQYDVSTVYEAQGKLGLMNYDIRPIQQGRSICGTAVTAICYAGDNLMIHAAIEVCKPQDILVVSIIGNSRSGMIGELIVQALIKRQVQGVIIDAGIRDVVQIRELGFPVWSKSIYSEGTAKSKGGWVNAEATCGGVLVHPGDVILADDDGIVVIKQEDIDETIESARQRTIEENKIKEKIARGELSLDYHNLRDVLEQQGVIYYDTLNKE